VTTPHTDDIKWPSVRLPVDEIPESVIQRPDTFLVPSDGDTELAIDLCRTQLDTAPTHEHVTGTSNMPIDVKWWLNLTLQDIQDQRASNNLHVAGILVRQCTKIIRRYRSQPEALTFQDLLIELSEFSSASELHPFMQNCEDWMDGDYRCHMRLMHLKSQDPKMTGIHSLHLRICDSSGFLPGLTFETRLYHDVETRLNSANQAYIVACGHHRSDTCLFKINYTCHMYAPLLDSRRKAFLKQPCAAFLRDELGNVVLSVSRLLPMRLTVALMIQGRSKIRRASHLPFAS
jgi:hypothetical protein